MNEKPTIDTGGPAFPSGKLGMNHEYSSDGYESPFLGMSIRTHLAARNVAALIGAVDAEGDGINVQYIDSDYEPWPEGSPDDLGYRYNPKMGVFTSYRRCSPCGTSNPMFHRRTTTYRQALVREAIAYADETIRQLRGST